MRLDQPGNWKETCTYRKLAHPRFQDESGIGPGSEDRTVSEVLYLFGTSGPAK